MPRNMKKRLLTTALATLALVAVSGLVGSATAPASAGTIVDPATLVPPPPPGAVCRADGRYVICHTFLDFSLVNEPVFELPCGTVYETSLDHREGIRFYVDGLLVKRFVTQDIEGTWSLSPTGTEPTVRLFAHDTWWNDFPVAGDESSAITTFHGNGIRVQLPAREARCTSPGSTCPTARTMASCASSMIQGRPPQSAPR
jgi:hypothetical protein